MNERPAEARCESGVSVRARLPHPLRLRRRALQAYWVLRLVRPALQLGVKHSSIPVDPPMDFVSVLDEEELQIGETQGVSVTDIPVLVSRTAEVVHAVGGVCTHRGAPLAEGERVDGCIACPWHGSLFALDTGASSKAPRRSTWPVLRRSSRGDRSRYGWRRRHKILLFDL
jgi:nitrite reductase/ring-hydroxylating ferredoxin subunit